MDAAAPPRRPRRSVPFACAALAVLAAIALYLPWHDISNQDVFDAPDCASAPTGCAHTGPWTWHTDSGADHAGPEPAILLGLVAACALLAAAVRERLAWRAVGAIILVAQVLVARRLWLSLLFAHLMDDTRTRAGSTIFDVAWLGCCIAAILLIARAIRFTPPLPVARVVR